MTPERREELGRIAYDEAGNHSAFPDRESFDDTHMMTRSKYAAIAEAVANAIVPEGLAIERIRIAGSRITLDHHRIGGWILVWHGSGSHPAVLCDKAYWTGGKTWNGSPSEAVVFDTPAAALAEYREHIEGRE